MINIFNKIRGCFRRNKSLEEIAASADFDIIKQRRALYESNALVSNSVDEQYIYVALQKCECGGSYHAVSQALLEKEGTPHDRLDAICIDCDTKKAFEFDISRYYGEPSLYHSLNPFDRPSSIIDVAQWYQLADYHLRAFYRVFGENERQDSLQRSLSYINEALKFYQPDSEYPPETAFFNHPEEKLHGLIKEQFKKSNLLELKKTIQETLAIASFSTN